MRSEHTMLRSDTVGVIVQAYADYTEILELTEAMIRACAVATAAQQKASHVHSPFQADGPSCSARLHLSDCNNTHKPCSNKYMQWPSSRRA